MAHRGFGTTLPHAGYPPMSNEAWLQLASGWRHNSTHVHVMVPCSEAGEPAVGPSNWWGHTSWAQGIVHVPAPLVSTSVLSYHLGKYFF